jgi:hypothetical protein
MVHCPLVQIWPVGHMGHPGVPQAGKAGQLPQTLLVHTWGEGHVPQLTVLPQLFR